MLKRVLRELVSAAHEAVAAVRDVTPLAAYRIPRFPVERPRRIELAAWAELPPERRAPARGIAFVERRGAGYRVFILDAAAMTAVWSIDATPDQLSLLLEKGTESGDDRAMPLVFQSVVCPDCEPAVVVVKDKPPTGEDEPWRALLVRARIVERALAAAPVHVDTGDGRFEALIG